VFLQGRSQQINEIGSRIDEDAGTVGQPAHRRWDFLGCDDLTRAQSSCKLVNGLPSAISFGPVWPAFDRFVGTMPLCDYRLRKATGSLGSGVPRGPPVSMRAWGLRLRRAASCSRGLRTLPCCLPVGLTPSAPMVLAISELINFRNTQPTYASRQRFQCVVTADLTWLWARMVRYSFPV
jgi:hypothetical protein